MSTKKSSIRNKIAAVFVAVIVLSLVASGLLSVFQLRRIRNITEDSLISLTRSDLQSLTIEKGSAINSRLQTYVDLLDIMTGYIADMYANPQQYLPNEVPYYLDMPEGELGLHYFPEPWADASSLADETRLLGNAAKIFSAVMAQFSEITTICVSTESGQNLQFDTDAAFKRSAVEGGFSSHSRPWYIDAAEQGRFVISDTYRDAAGRGLTITMSAPIFADGIFKGVMCFDIRIDDLDEQLRKEVVGESGRIELVGNDKMISSRNLTLENENELPEYWSYLTMYETGAAVSRDEYIAWSRIPLTGWRVVLLVPESQVTAPVREADSQIYTAILLTVLLLVAIVLLTVYIAFLSARRITAPLSALASDAEKIGKGEDIELTARTGDEIERLANTINEMLVNIKTITGEKERIGAELDVATKIQSSMLPCIFPAFPERAEFDIYAIMQPAKEVGGDFYDFFLIDDNKLAVVMADVSGKGVPAALFMVIAKTLIKNNAQYGKSPKEVFETVNNLLCEGNDAGMFVTAFLGYLDLTTGQFTSVNAGHNPPLIGRSGVFEYYRTKRGFVLAGTEDVSYKQATVALNPGDMLFLYTDGITEADNPYKELYGETRLLEALNSHPDAPLKELCVTIRRDIDGFASGAEQADDITMLVMKYCGGGRTNDTY